MIKRIGMLSILAATFNVQAVECDFETVKGIDFTFERHSDLKNYFSESIYSHWYETPSNNKNIDYNVYYARDAKLHKDNVIVKKEVNPSDIKNFINARYYPATVDNCKTVYLRIDESSPNTKRYFDNTNFLTKSHPQFEWEEDLIDVQFTNDFVNVRNHVGKQISLMPLSDMRMIRARSLDHDKFFNLQPQQYLNLKKVERIPFSENGVNLSHYRLIVEDASNQLFYLPWDPEIIFLGDHLQRNGIRKEFYDSILAGKIQYGMNKFEIQATWGVPDKVRRQVIYLQKQVGEWVNDDLYPYAGKEEYMIFPNADMIPTGIESDWYYNSRLAEGQYLVIDKFGLFREYNQIFRIEKNTVQLDLNNRIK